MGEVFTKHRKLESSFQAPLNPLGPHPLASLYIHGSYPLTPSIGPSEMHAASLENVPVSSTSLNFPVALWPCFMTQKGAVHIITYENSTSEVGQRRRPCLHLLPD